MGRIACVRIARFEMAVFARTDPALWTRVVAIAELASPRARVRALTPVAEEQGVRAGQTVSEALSLCPSLQLLAPDADALDEAGLEILKALSTLSPTLDADGQGAFFLGMGGLAELHPDELVFAGKARALLHELGFQARVGVADRSLAAWVAARRATPLECVPPGDDLRILSNVPVSELGLSVSTLERLSLWGLRTLGQLAALPPGALASRLPEEGPRLARLCRGEERLAFPTSSLIPDDAEEVSMDLEQPTDALEPLLFLFKSLLDRLLVQVARTRRTLALLLIVLRLDDRSETRHHITPATPSLDARVLMDLIRLWLSSAPLHSPIASVRLVAARIESPDVRQTQLLDKRRDQMEDALHRAASRLASAFGPENILRPTLIDTLRPEARLRWVPFETPIEKPARPPPPADAPALALKLYSPPEPVEWRGNHLRRVGRATLRIAGVDGPQRLSGEWWGESAFDRSYFWLTGVNGERLWIFRDESDGRFHLQAQVD